MNSDTLSIMPLIWWFVAVLVFLFIFKMR